MRIGAVILPEYPAAEAARRWRDLEQRGFAHGWTYDHLAWRSLADQPWYSTVVTLAVAATATTNLRIGTWVASPNFRHPVTFAKDLMSLDDLSGGRIVAAVGAGGYGFDSAVLGRPQLSGRERLDRLTEFTTLTDALLTHPSTTWSGDYFTAVEARTIPAGSRRRIELVVAGSGPGSVRLAARHDGWTTIGAAEADDARAWWSDLRRLVEIYDEAVGDRVTPRYLSAQTLPGYDHASIGSIVDAAGRAEELGFTDFVVHAPRAGEPYAADDAVLDQVAEHLVRP
jgi:alkanesulfonate monooxygenase SsuD/methylene tetrahydromethanopterin reductase-like flavin-dependent oxidoreductase (luciferase family)